MPQVQYASAPTYGGGQPQVTSYPGYGSAALGTYTSAAAPMPTVPAYTTPAVSAPYGQSTASMPTSVWGPTGAPAMPAASISAAAMPTTVTQPLSQPATQSLAPMSQPSGGFLPTAPSMVGVSMPMQSYNAMPPVAQASLPTAASMVQVPQATLPTAQSMLAVAPQEGSPYASMPSPHASVPSPVAQPASGNSPYASMTSPAAQVASGVQSVGTGFGNATAAAGSGVQGVMATTGSGVRDFVADASSGIAEAGGQVTAGAQSGAQSALAAAEAALPTQSVSSKAGKAGTKKKGAKKKWGICGC